MDELSPSRFNIAERRQHLVIFDISPRGDERSMKPYAHCHESHIQRMPRPSKDTYRILAQLRQINALILMQFVAILPPPIQNQELPWREDLWPSDPSHSSRTEERVRPPISVLLQLGVSQTCFPD